MEKLTFEQIKQRLIELEISEENFAFGGVDDEILGPCKEVHQVGGEGEGDHWESVHYFKNHDVYISVSAFYSSYNGTDFDGSEFEEVKPQQKTIIVYE